MQHIPKTYDVVAIIIFITKNKANVKFTTLKIPNIKAKKMTDTTPGKIDKIALFVLFLSTSFALSVGLKKPYIQSNATTFKNPGHNADHVPAQPKYTAAKANPANHKTSNAPKTQIPAGKPGEEPLLLNIIFIPPIK